MTDHATPQTANPVNGASSTRELFALTDEQILEIEPEGEVNVAPPFRAASSSPEREVNVTCAPVISSLPAQAGEARTLRPERLDGARNPSSAETSAEFAQLKRDSSVAALPRNDGTSQAGTQDAEIAPGSARPSVASHDSPATSHQEPPPWLAAQMKDPWNGEDAQELWNGIQQARQEAAAYREVFAKPEEARAAAERARTLEDIDAAFYGGGGKSPQEIGAARAALAQRLMREDPAAFREMVFAGLRALEETNVVEPNAARARTGSDQQNLSPERINYNDGAKVSFVGAQHAAPLPDNAAHGAHLAAYRAFEESANEELERSVGGAIERALTQALPVRGGPGTQTGVPTLQQRLGAAIREDIEAALKGDANSASRWRRCCLRGSLMTRRARRWCA